MKKIINILCYITIITNIGCTKDEVTILNGNICNSSTVPISLITFESGLILKDTLTLKPGDTIKISKDSKVYGDVTKSVFESEILSIGQNDSIKIIYNNLFEVLHLIDSPDIIFNKKFLTIEMSRNIINRNNYYLEMIRKKNARINNNYFTFTEDDYNFAKEP